MVSAKMCLILKKYDITTMNWGKDMHSQVQKIVSCLSVTTQFVPHCILLPTDAACPSSIPYRFQKTHNFVTAATLFQSLTSGTVYSKK
jgi:hypothetical protein